MDTITKLSKAVHQAARTEGARETAEWIVRDFITAQRTDEEAQAALCDWITEAIQTAGDLTLGSVPQLAGITFSPLPTPKPSGGYLEVGEYDGDTYAFENSVELMAGSDGRVYAVVAEHISDLPDIDEEGRPLQRDERATGEPGDGIRCPTCGSETIFVVQVSCLHHTKPHTGRWPLTVDGFAWDELGSHRDGSTEDEIAECDDCGYCCPAGALHEFGFGSAEAALNTGSGSGLECAECGQIIAAEAEAESTYCGSLHPACVGEHCAHCTICRDDIEDSAGCVL